MAALYHSMDRCSSDEAQHSQGYRFGLHVHIGWFSHFFRTKAAITAKLIPGMVPSLIPMASMPIGTNREAATAKHQH